jgi:hypothetical protein
MSKPQGNKICKCECGGTVRGIDQFNRAFTWCEKCTLVVQVKLPRAGDLARDAGKP